jgi:hypothetical protein
MICIILTAAQATAARGKYSARAALDPVQLGDGTWALPARCLVDIAQARGKSAPAVTALLSLPRRDLPADEFFFKTEIDEVEYSKVSIEEAKLYKKLDTGLPEER